MAVRLRLTRMGRKKRPFYRIVAVDSRRTRDGAYIEKLGHYNPLTNPPEIVVNEERALDWLMKGAQPSKTVKSIFKNKGIMLQFDLKKKGASEEKIKEELTKLQVVRQIQAEKAASEVKTQPEPETADTTEAQAPDSEEKPEEPQPEPETADTTETQAPDSEEKPEEPQPEPETADTTETQAPDSEEKPEEPEAPDTTDTDNTEKTDK